MSPVSLQLSLVVAGLTSLLGLFILVRLVLEFRALKALHSRNELEPLLVEFATTRNHLNSFKGREWFMGRFVLRLLQKRLWDAAESPDFQEILLNKMRHLNQLNLSASQLAYELESLTNGQQSTF